ncbi:DUF2642 domain-containing protein [Pseudobacillus wudalianchiensis]|uniref:DUF2642 domain-containing protein n=1 Tax=Pseudobacillus wudalianchiensis TaxID=1743143 RepID=A0A1B9B9T8_9BACI|nr:DUF2642 domain-containing protein [Bacillus wudalianchiensis]OCA92842.1 hypothetical protein A8F95_03915 [Bacillus wudalianchiensis]
MKRYPYNDTKVNSLFPPGQYSYSSTFPSIMQSLSPSYTIQAEPVFLDHLLTYVGENIHVATVNESLEGTLTSVAIDHLQLTVDDVNYHIRYPHIIYFRKM